MPLSPQARETVDTWLRAVKNFDSLPKEADTPVIWYTFRTKIRNETVKRLIHIKEFFNGTDKTFMDPKPKKEEKEKSMFLALLLLLGAAGLVFAYLGSEDRKPKDGHSPVVKSEKFEKSVNRHLMLTNERMELEKQRMAVENARLLNEPTNNRPQKAYTNDNRLDLSMDTRAAELANELGRGTRKEEIASPHDTIQRELYSEQEAQMTSQAYKEAYAKQFIENARKGGYIVKLSEDLSRVISVTPIRTPTNQMELFGGNAGGRQ